MNLSESPLMVLRRTLVSAAAWSAPVIVVGVAAPVVAASGVTVSAAPEPGCREPGAVRDWSYRLPLIVSSPVAGVLVVGSVSAPGDPDAVVVSAPSEFPAGVSRHEVVISASNSANGVAVLSWTAAGLSGTVAVSWAGLRPCKDGAA